MKKILLLSLIVLSVMHKPLYSQEGDVDVFLIDAYITPELPNTLIVSFFTSQQVTAKLILEEKYEFDISTEFAEDHKLEIDLTDYSFDSSFVRFYFEGEVEDGSTYKSEIYETGLPYKNQLKSDRNTSLLTVCCFGGVIFGLPAPTMVFQGDKSYFSLAKEIPFLSFYSGGYNYPMGYISVEYAHIFESETSNFTRLGYKHIFSVPVIHYVSTGISGFTDFDGFNGFSPEVTFGLFELYNAFTFYTRYRYNFQPSNSVRDFHEISIGLYSNFFSLNL